MQAPEVLAERQWLALLASLDDPYPVMREFARQYHFFSVQQVIAFTGLFRAIAADDRASLANLAEVLYEELGAGVKENVHSLLFEKFAAGVGVDVASLPIPVSEVAEGVLAYVEALRDSFFASSAAEACAAYVFLESSAVETYAPLLATLQNIGVPDEALVFFKRHAEVEPGHKEAAKALAQHYVVDQLTRSAYEMRFQVLAQKWENFWLSIAERTRGAQ